MQDTMQENTGSLPVKILFMKDLVHEKVQQVEFFKRPFF